MSNKVTKEEVLTAGIDFIKLINKAKDESESAEVQRLLSNADGKAQYSLSFIEQAFDYIDPEKEQ